MAPEHGRRHVHHAKHYRTAYEPGELREYREHRHCGNRRDDARHYEEADRREPHRRKRIKFLVHLHRADFGGKRAPRAAGKHDGRDERAEFAEKPYRKKVGDIHLDAEHPERGSRLEREDKPQEKADAGRYGQRVERRALERKRSVAQAEPPGVYKHAEGTGRRLAEKREVLARRLREFACAAAKCLKGFHFSALSPSIACAYALENARENAAE